MESFRTIVSVNRSSRPITHKTSVLTAGSCFADAMGSRLQQFKFDAMANPFGILYNPITIHKVLQESAHLQFPPHDSFLQNHEVYLNYNFHSEVSATNRPQLEEKIKTIVESAHQFLKKTKWLMITYGTAWVYQRKDNQQIVANCHKMPAQLFNKVLLTEHEIVNSFQELQQTLRTFNPDLKFILTVSPVRHIKDTLELNSVSKSILRMACHTLATEHESVEYFPAFEMMMDDLRDYRFYKSDMLHPTEQAEDYIWERFSDRYFDPETKNLVNELKSICAALAHRPFHPGTTAHQQFLKDTLKKLEGFSPTINVNEEIAIIKQQLA